MPVETKFQTSLACDCTLAQWSPTGIITPTWPCGFVALLAHSASGEGVVGDGERTELGPSQGQPSRPVDISSGAGPGEAASEIPATAVVGFEVEPFLGLGRGNWRVGWFITGPIVMEIQPG